MAMLGVSHWYLWTIRNATRCWDGLRVFVREPGVLTILGWSVHVEQCVLGKDTGSVRGSNVPEAIGFLVSRRVENEHNLCGKLSQSTG